MPKCVAFTDDLGIQGLMILNVTLPISSTTRVVATYLFLFLIYRLYRAQRFYVQLLPKSMLLAILIGNGIRLQSTITLCHEKGFFMSYFTRHKGCMSISKKISEHK